MIFDEEFQLYFSWTMNLQEFISWVDMQREKLGAFEFDETYPTFQVAYKTYTDMLNGL